MWEEGEILRAAYSYDSSEQDASLLSFKSDDIFAVIKAAPESSSWIWVCDREAQLGYVPGNFVRLETLSDVDYVQILTAFIHKMQIRLEDVELDARTRKHLQHEIVKLKRSIQRRAVTSVNNDDGSHSATRVKFKDEEDMSISSCRLDSIARPTSKNSPRNSPTIPQRVSQPVLTPTEPKVESVQVSSAGASIARENANQSCLPEEEKEKETKFNTFAGATNECNGIVIENELSKTMQEVSEEACQKAHKMLQQIRISCDLPYEKCKSVLLQLLHSLQEFPSCKESLGTVAHVIEDADAQLDTPFLCSRTIDYERLQMLMEQLRACQQDEQQHDWPLRQDERQLRRKLDQLNSLLYRANPAVALLCIRQKQFEHVNTLIAYLQAERRRAIRYRLHRILLRMGMLEPLIIESQLLGSLLPIVLASEMLQTPIRTASGKEITSRNRCRHWISAARLFTMVFSTGHRPPINVYGHINQSFFEQMLDLAELCDGHSPEDSSDPDEDVDDHESAYKIENSAPSTHQRLPVEEVIAPILAFNLHYEKEEIDDNLVLQSLRNRTSASALLLQNLASHLNWGEDPTRIENLASVQSENVSNNKFLQKYRASIYISNAVQKLLTEMFARSDIASAFYFNDVSVLVDILVTLLNNLHCKDSSRVNLVQLLKNLLINTSYRKESTKTADIQSLLNELTDNEMTSDEERQLARQIQDLLNVR